jgi:hypothetical protein
MKEETTRDTKPSNGWVVEIETGCWLTTWPGDPGRTLAIENAGRYKTRRTAECALRQAREFRPLVDAKIYRFVNMD